MPSPVTAFYDKTPNGDGHYSMTRVINFLFAICYLVAMETYAFRGKEINWAFAILGFGVLLAVPIQALLSFLGQWISSSEGRELLTTAVHKAEEALMSQTPAGLASTIKTTTTVTPGEKG